MAGSAATAGAWTGNNRCSSGSAFRRRLPIPKPRPRRDPRPKQFQPELLPARDDWLVCRRLQPLRSLFFRLLFFRCFFDCCFPVSVFFGSVLLVFLNNLKSEI